MTEQQETMSPAEQQLEFTFDRTIWAAERTLMAWTRTCLTLITFGLAIELFFWRATWVCYSMAAWCFGSRAIGLSPGGPWGCFPP